MLTSAAAALLLALAATEGAVVDVDCAAASGIVAAHGVALDEDCRALSIAAGGFLEIERDDGWAFCGNAGLKDATARLSTTALLVEADPPLACSPDGRCAQPEPSSLYCHVVTAEAAGEVSPPANALLAVFVLDFKSAHASTTTASDVLGRLVAVEAGRLDGVSVMSGAEVRRMLSAEAARQTAGCADEASCLADVAGALGARYVVAGEVNVVGRALRLEISLLDTERGAVVARESALARDLVDMAPLVDDVTHNLFTAVLGDERAPLPPPRLARAMEDPGALLGAAQTGAGSVVAAGCCALAPMLVTVPLGLLWCASPYWTAESLLCFTPSLCCLPCAAAIGGGAAAVGADLFHDVEPSVGRVVLAALLGGACGGTALVAGASVGLFGAPVLGLLALGEWRKSFGLGVTLTAAVLATVVAGGAAAAAYEAGVGLFGDEPARREAGGDGDDDEEHVARRASLARAQAY